MTRLRELLAQLQPLDLNYGRPLEAFTVFPKLPLELKKKIWKYLIDEPRMIRLHQVTWEDDNPSNPVMIKGLPVPAILHVCRQARIEGLPHYELIHQNGLNKNGEDNQLEAAPAKMLYVNFKADQFILYSVSSDAGFIDKLNFDKTVLKKIQHPAVYCYAWNRGMSDTQSALLRARLLASIFHTYKAKELTVIYHRAWALSSMGDSLARHLFRRTVLDSLPSRFEMPAGEKWWWGCPQTITDDLSMPLNVLWDVIDDDDLSPWYTMGETAVSHGQ